jgi:VanZ family protein
VVLLLALVFGDAPERTLFWRTLFNAGHAPLFGVLALLIRHAIAGRGPAVLRGHASATAFVLAMALGVAGEAVQMLQPGREVSVDDVLRNAAGAAAFLLLRAAWVRRAAEGARARRTRMFSTVAAVALLLAAGARLAWIAAVYVARNRELPTLTRFDGSFWERELIWTQRSRLTPARPADGGAQSSKDVNGPAETFDPAAFARLDLRPDLYPGISIDEPYPDWNGYRSLVLTIASDLAEPFSLVIRIHDAEHNHQFGDRFNKRLVIQPGVNRIVIPIEEIRQGPERRQMDTTRVRNIMLFAHQLQQPTHVFLGPITLE